MANTSAHPREGGDPVLSSLARAFQDDGLRLTSYGNLPKNWVPAFAGMSGFLK